MEGEGKGWNRNTAHGPLARRFEMARQSGTYDKMSGPYTFLAGAPATRTLRRNGVPSA